MTDKITLVAAVIAFAAMCIAVWQAREARQSRRATQEQADTAKKSLMAAERQSTAADKSATAAILAVGAAERAAAATEEQAIEARKAVRIAQEAHDLARKTAQRERSDQEHREHRAHATCISAWPVAGPSFGIQLVNTSDEPIYEVVVLPVFIQGAAPRTGEEWAPLVSRLDNPEPSPHVVFGALLPGRWRTQMPPVDTGIPGGRLGVEIGFSDRNGNHWIRRATGVLEEIPNNAIDYYDIWRPLAYSEPEPEA